MKSVMVTTSWDDGHKLDMRLARLLKKYGLKGTFYIAPEDREFTPGDRLNKDEIKRLSKSFEIGAHTMTHPRLPQVDDSTAKQEIITSKIWLEQQIGQPIKSFCYPGGAYDSEHVKMVKDAGFSYGRTVSRFCKRKPKKAFEAGTTIHAYRHWSDAPKILLFAKFHPAKFYRYLIHWDKLATALYDEISSRGGVFHLWGHSWEIDANGDWDRLEAVFKYISKQPSVQYVTNEELLWKQERKSSL
ncbi:MAG TPA: polysaccharide deacetylase family protein [Candidatus Saccharimonadales bacterium]|nr:polysaccharide deacetylase family protein [Candidatus Saccharimonadales bacterium]